MAIQNAILKWDLMDTWGYRRFQENKYMVMKNQLLKIACFMVAIRGGEIGQAWKRVFWFSVTKSKNSK